MQISTKFNYFKAVNGIADRRDKESMLSLIILDLVNKKQRSLLEFIFLTKKVFI